jgi:hypothetical protein
MLTTRLSTYLIRPRMRARHVMYTVFSRLVMRDSIQRARPSDFVSRRASSRTRGSVNIPS